MTYLETAIKIIKTIESHGFEAYIVGGFVRDYILNIPSNDIDITTSALPEDIAKIFDKVIPTGIAYEGVTVILDEYSFEITTFRKDIAYYDHRHPETRYASTLEEDLARRDFTINAMAFDKDLNLIDIFRGQQDLNNKIIKAVGKPEVRFNEDALRILRGYYFAAKLNFDIDPDTIKGMDLNAKYLEYVSSERITRELEKLFSQENQHKGIFYLISSEAINYLPSLKRALISIYNIDNNISFNELLCLGFYLEGETSRYSLTKAMKRQISSVLDLIDEEFDTLTLFNNKIEDLLIANDIKKILKMDYIKDISSVKENLIIHSIKELAIKPKDLINLGFENENIGRELNRILKLVLDKKVANDKEKILSIVKN